MIFSHWAQVNGEAYDPKSQCYQIIQDVRKRKGLKEAMPDFNDYYDKL
jgi:elongation factor 2